MSSDNVVSIPWSKPQFPDTTPQGQHFTTQQLGVGGTPHGIRENAGALVVDGIREKIAREMNNETLLCPIDTFLKHYGPFETVRTGDVKKCKKALIEAKLFDQQTGRWTKFANDPSQFESSEQEVFKNLKPIVDKILAFAKGRRNNYKFEVVERKYLEADIPGTNHKMDGCLVDGEFKTGKIPVRFIKSPHEYKKKRTAKHQRIVRAQVVGDSHHILCEDPRRMFIFAITIEDTHMSVWYFSRSHSMKAISFDWVEKDVDTFIQVFLAFAYASPEQLGVDPTVHLAPINPKAKPGTEAAAQHYIYQCPVETGAEDVQDAQDGARRSVRLAAPKFKYFKTMYSINDMRPYNMSGRNTRIWRVVEVKGPDTDETVSGEHLVLKDVWLETTRPTEAKNMDDIFKAIDHLVKKSKETWGDDWKERLVAEDRRFASFDGPTKTRLQHFLTDENYKLLFLTKLHAWNGATSKTLCKGALNSAPGVDIFPEESAIEKPGYNCRTGQGSLVRSVVASFPADTNVPVNPPPVQDEKPDPAQKARRQFPPKQQSRFVFKEQCFDLDKVGTLGNFMDLISQALDALRILFCAGWVHRDISSGNLLAFNDNGKWKIKLSDLEFAEKLGYDSKRSDPRTGTPFFMPFEILNRFHLLNDIRAEPDQRSSMAALLELPKGCPEYNFYKTFSQFGTRTKSIPPTVTENIPTKKTVIRYNFQHDLESIWWIVLHFITALVDHGDSQAYARLVFKRSLDVTAHAVRNQVFEKRFGLQVGDHLHPTLADPFSTFMEQLRIYMREEYLARELFGQLTVHESYSAIHGYFATQLRDFLEANEGNWKQMPIAPNGDFTRTQFGGSKRGFEHDEPAASVSMVDKKRKLAGK